MNDNTLIVVRAFSGLDKEAGCASASKPKGNNYNLRHKKKATIVKEALSANVIGDDDVIDVDVTRIEKSAKLAALEALDAMKNVPDKVRPSGVTNAAVSKVGVLRSQARNEKQKKEQSDALGNAVLPKMSALVRQLLIKRAEGGAAGQPDPYAAFQQMQEDGNTVSKAIPGLDPNVVLQGQQQGVDMTPGAIKKRLGAHEQIAKGKKILRDDNKNGVPDIAEGGAGAGAGAGMGEQALAGGQPQAQPQQDPAQMISAAKLRMSDLTKAAVKATLNAQNAKKKDEEEETKPGVVMLELASDQPAKKAPEKKPEKDSENEAETTEKKADMGAGAAPLKVASGLPRREGFKTTSRQSVFDDLGKWSLGKDM